MRLAAVAVVVAAWMGNAVAADKPRVFITDSKSWEISGAAGGSGAFGAQVHGGARPQTAEIIKTFGERCPNVTINNKQDKADYVVLLDHEGGKGWIRKDNKVAVFNKDGDSIISKSTRSLGSSEQEACEAIKADWPKQSAVTANSPTGDSASAAAPAPNFSNTKVQITSEPVGGDIEIDGSYIGNTPSTIELTPGEHTLGVKKAGYKDWQRKIKASGGSINVAAQLEKAD